MIIIWGNNKLNPVITQSTNWKCWYAKLSLATCKDCRELNLRIFEMYKFLLCPLHPRCRCHVDPLGAIYNGTATTDGLLGADVWLKMYGELPKNYVDKDYAKAHGWKRFKGNLRDVLPGATMGGDIYFNAKKKLPEKNGRIWYEADINYDDGFRNTHRILYSNDGLVFVTYDHYNTFYEII